MDWNKVVSEILALAGLIGALSALIGVIVWGLNIYLKHDRAKLEQIDKELKAYRERQQINEEQFNKLIQKLEDTSERKKDLEAIQLRYDILANMRQAKSVGYKDELLLSETAQLIEIYQNHYNGNHITKAEFDAYDALPSYKEWLELSKNDFAESVKQEVKKVIEESE